MKKILLAVCILCFVVSAPASTLIYKGTMVRKELYDYSNSEPIAIPASYKQIRIVIVRTTEPLVRPSTGRPGFAVSLDAKVDDVQFNFANESTDRSSCSFLIDTPPDTIVVIPRNQIGTFAIYIWGS